MATTARRGGDSTLKYLRERNEETVKVREIQDLNLRSARSGMKEQAMGGGLGGWG